MNRYLTLTICAVIGFCSLMLQYATRSLNPVSARLGYAVFSTVLPALLGAALIKIFRLRIKVVGSTFLYLGLFILVQIVLWIF